MTAIAVLAILVMSAVVWVLDQWGDRIWWSAVIALAAQTGLAAIAVNTPTGGAPITALVSMLTAAAGVALIAAEATSRGVPLQTLFVPQPVERG